MAEHTGIEWTEATWNPIVGCTVVSPGCSNCYAMKLAGRLERMGSPIYRGLTQDSKAGPVWNGKVELSNLGQQTAPLRWRKPRRVFVNSMSDLFHESVPDKWIDQVFGVMTACPQHTFQILTKRAERMQNWVSQWTKVIERGPLEAGALELERVHNWFSRVKLLGRKLPLAHGWPLPNVWLGVSVEDQKRAGERIPCLLATPARVRFLSCEPLLGPLELWSDGKVAIDWVIVGGESGPGAREMRADWARSIRDQCRDVGVAFFMKQMSRKAQIPDDLMVREFPSAA